MFLLPSTTPSRIIAVPSELIPLAGDGNSAIFLAQVLFWWKAKGRQKFYKFNAPCTHAFYRAGDSWTEELGMRRTMFMTARRRVAVKVRITCRDAVQQAFDEGVLVVYGTDEHHLTWYMVNEATLKRHSPALYARLLGSEPSPDSASDPYRRATPRPQPAKVPSDSPQHLAPPSATVPAPANTVSTTSAVPSECGVSPPAEGEGLHSLMQGSCTGITESPSQRAPEPASENSLPNHLLSKTIPLPTAPVPAGEGGGTTREGQRVEFVIFTGLQGRGVQAGPARLIARRAVRAGWDADRTLAVFDAHVLDAKRAGVRSPVAVAVSRMARNEQIFLPPPDALARVRWLHREHAGQRREEEAVERYVEVGMEVDDRGGEGVEGVTETEREVIPSPLKTLWQNVLGDIKLQVTRATFEQCFKGTWLEERDGTYVVCASDPLALEWLAHRLKGLITETLGRWGGSAVQPQFACS